MALYNVFIPQVPLFYDFFTLNKLFRISVDPYIPD